MEKNSIDETVFAISLYQDSHMQKMSKEKDLQIKLNENEAYCTYKKWGGESHRVEGKEEIMEREKRKGEESRGDEEEEREGGLARIKWPEPVDSCQIWIGRSLVRRAAACLVWTLLKHLMMPVKEKFKHTRLSIPPTFGQNFCF